MPPNEAYFQFGTNAGPIADEIAAAMNRALAAVRQAQAGFASSGTPTAGFLGTIQQRLDAVTADAHKQIQDIERRQQAAARAPGKYQRPAEGTLRQEIAGVEVAARERYLNVARAAMDELPKGVDPTAVRSIVGAGGMALQQSLNSMFVNANATLREVAAAAGRPRAIPAVSAALVRPQDQRAMQAQIEALRSSDERIAEAVRQGALTRGSLADPTGQAQISAAAAETVRRVNEQIAAQIRRSATLTQLLGPTGRPLQPTAVLPGPLANVVRELQTQMGTLVQRYPQVGPGMAGGPLADVVRQIQAAQGTMFQHRPLRLDQMQPQMLGGNVVQGPLHVAARQLQQAQLANVVANNEAAAATRQVTGSSQRLAAAQANRAQAAVPGGPPRRGGHAGAFLGTFDGDEGPFTPENVVGHAARYARYAVVAAAIFGLQRVIRDTRDEAVEFAESFTDLDVAIGEGREVRQSFVNDLQDIARLAGANVAQAMDSAARSIRAFGDPATMGLEQLEDIGIRGARAAERLAIIADKDIKNAMGDIVAIGSSFGLTADQLDRVNESIAGAKRLGGVPGEIAQGMAGSATAFREAGFDMVEQANILSVVIARLDQSGTLTASRLSRVLQISRGPGVQAELAQVFRGAGEDVPSDIAGQIGLLARLEAEGRLTEEQLRRLQHRMGGVANSREFISMLRNWGQIQGNVNDSILEGGRATDEYDRKINNLSGLLRKITGDLANIQTGLLQAEIFAPIGVLLELIEPALRSLADLLRLYNTFMDAATGFMPDALAGPFQAALPMVLQYMAAMRVLSRINAQRIVSQGPAAPMAGATLFGPRYEARTREQAFSRIARDYGATPAGGATAAAQARTVAAANAEIAARTRLGGSMLYEQGARAQLVASINAAAASLRGLSASALLGARGLPGRLGPLRSSWADGNYTPGVLARGARGVGSALSTPVGSMVGWMAAFAAVQGLADAANRAAQAADATAVALRAVGTAADEQGFRDAAQSLASAAAEHEDAASGFFSGIRAGFFTESAIPGQIDTESVSGWQAQAGNIVGGMLDILTVGVASALGEYMGGDTTSQMELARQNHRAALTMMDLADRLVDSQREAAAQNPGGVFGGRLETTEQLEIGLATLREQGAGAATILNAVAKALGDIGETRPEGWTPDEQGTQLGIQLGDALWEVMREQIAGRAREADSLIPEDRLADVEAFRATAEAEDPARARRDLRKRLGTERYDEAARLDTQERAAQEEALRVAEESMPNPEAMANLRRQIVDTTERYVEDARAAGGEGTQFTPEQLSALATEVATAVFGADAETWMEEHRGALEAAILAELQGMLEGGMVQMDAAMAAAYAKLSIAEAQNAARQVEMMPATGMALPGGPTAGARARVDSLKAARDLILKSGQEVPEELTMAIIEAERTLADRMRTVMQSRNKLAQALAPFDEAMAGRHAYEEASARAGAAMQANDEAAWNEAQAEIAAINRRNAQTERERSVAARRATIDPRSTVRMAGLELDAAQQRIDELRAAGDDVDENGNQTREFSEALIDYSDKVLAQAEAVLSRRSAQARATIDPRDVITLARQDIADTQAALAGALQGTEEYFVLQFQLAEQELALARLQAERASNLRRALIDPRDTVANAVEDARAAREALAAMHVDDPAYGAQQRAVREAELAEDRARVERANAARTGRIDPRNRLARLRADLANAVDLQRTMLQGEQDWWQQNDRIMQIREEIAQLRADEAHQRRLLGIDLTDPVEMARAELRRERQTLRRLQRSGAPQAMIDEQTNKVRSAEHAREAAAFSERFRAMQTANELGRISHQRYIQYLNNERDRLMAIADRTHQQQEHLDQIDRALKAASDEMQGQFNIGDIKLPTIYEVRRSIAARAAGTDYHGVPLGARTAAAATTTVDNRSAVVNFNGLTSDEMAQRMIRELERHLGRAASARATRGRKV